MGTSLTGQTFATADVVAGQKLYAANYLALIAQSQALNDELIAECMTLAGTQTITDIKTFTAKPVFSAGAACGSSKLTAVADPSNAQDAATKAYVETTIATNIGGDTTVLVDSEANTMLKDHAYLAQTSGFASAWFTGNGNYIVSGYIGITTDPAGAGILVTLSSDSTAKASIYMFVPKGKYFEITSNTTVIITWTPMETSGGAPIDQD